MTQSHTTRRRLAILLVICAIGFLGWFLNQIRLKPVNLETEVNDASIYLDVDIQRKWNLQACFLVTWAIDGIQKVEFNGNGVVGQDVQAFCTSSGFQFEWLVTFTDGQTETYQLRPFRADTVLAGATLAAVLLLLTIAIDLWFGLSARWIGLSRTESRLLSVVSVLIVVLFAIVVFQVRHTGDYSGHGRRSIVVTTTGNLVTPHFFVHMVSGVIARATPSLHGKNALRVSVIMSYPLTILAAYYLIRSIAGQPNNKRAIRVYVGAATLVLFLHPVILFTLPRTDISIYHGFFTLHPHHNPTTLFIRPMVLLSMIWVPFLVMKHPISVVPSAVLTILAVNSKPSFTIVLLPALALFMGWRFIRRQTINWALLIWGFGVPAVAVLGWQYIVGFGTSNSNDIIFAPFAVYANHTPEPLWFFAPYMLLMSILFPLCVFVFYYDHAKSDPIFTLGWVTAGVAVATAYLFSETVRAAHFNFLWGVQLALLVLFTVALAYYIHQVVLNASRMERRWATIICSMTLTLHVLSGLFWVGYHLAGQPEALWFTLM